MPCWEVNYMSVEFKAEHVDLLIDALEALGYRYLYNEGQAYIDVLTGRFTIHLDTQKVKYPEEAINTVNKLKQEYSLQALQRVAAKKKWFIKQQSKTSGVIRRY